MRKYRVGKGDRYTEYVLETLRVMYGAGVAHFTIPDVVRWGGLNYNPTLRRQLDEFALQGIIHVDFQEMRDKKHPRSYNMFSSAFFGTIEPD